MVIISFAVINAANFVFSLFQLISEGKSCVLGDSTFSKLGIIAQRLLVTVFWMDLIAFFFWPAKKACWVCGREAKRLDKIQEEEVDVVPTEENEVSHSYIGNVTQDLAFLGMNKSDKKLYQSKAHMLEKRESEFTKRAFEGQISAINDD